MRTLVTGSSGHLGEGLVRTLKGEGADVVGLDIKPSHYTDLVGSITDPEITSRAMDGVSVVFHTATLHKPHVATHSKQDFVHTNVTGTLMLLEAASRAGVEAFVFTSSTSVFGDAMRPGPSEPTVWIDEDVAPQPKNIYGATKLAAEDLCQLFWRNHGLPTMVLRTARFFPEEDDDRQRRNDFDQDNLKVVELLNRRADIADVVSAHRAAANHASEIGHARFVISATTPFDRDDLNDLRQKAPAVLAQRIPDYQAEFARRTWTMLDGLDRVYSNARARAALGWSPEIDFTEAVRRLAAGEDYRSPLARAIGAKGYHADVFSDGPYPVTAA